VAEEIIVHHGASIAVSGLGKADEAFLAALVRGEFGVDDDGDTVAQAQLRARLTHAFMKYDPEYLDAAAQTLDIFDLKPEDEATRTMVAGWLDEIYGAPHHILRQEGQKARCRDGLAKV
jgi:hypothetical protein